MDQKDVETVAREIAEFYAKTLEEKFPDKKLCPDCCAIRQDPPCPTCGGTGLLPKD